ncbi:ell-associated factor [Ophiostoma piceae UAMH 11346]|uniref:Ell-associated factor n=1 Tax=Ophiostoma piceae (strain UAMH 11346) TaxID=1262450 RepID=S3BTD9_OPHP1|nr:ell-associated factor [Ophiostoma piceae UAMH 11346]
MATSSQALARAGLIDPTKPGSYPVVLGDDIRRSSDDSTDRVFTGIRYNFKPKHLTDKTTQKTSTLTPSGDGDFDVTFRDNSGGRYIFAGQRVTKGGKYVLVFDSKGRKFILHRLDSLFVMNMTDTPTDHDTDGLKKKHPYIDALTKRPRPRGATPLARRPMMKKAPSGPMRPMQKSSSRPPPKPTVLRSSHEIKKKDKRVLLSVPTQEPERETKAAKEIREQREAIIVKDARSSKEARETPNGKEKNGSDSSGSSNSPLGSSSRDARDPAMMKSRGAAFPARPKESSKLWRETKASPDSKPADYGSGDDYKSRSIDVKSFKGPKASESAKSKLAERPNKATTTSKGSSKEVVKDTVRVATRKDTGKDASTPRGKEGSKTGTPASTNSKTGKSASKAKASAPLSLPMPEAAAAAPAPKKKRRDWEEEDDEEEEDDDFGFVIEYPEGPSHPVRSAASANARNGAASTPQLHMTSFAEFANGGDGEEEDDGFWDVTKDDKNTAATPAPTPGKSSKSSGHNADDDEADLEAQLEEELNKEMGAGAGADVDAAFEAELEAEFFASESESEISEEE